MKKILYLSVTIVLLSFIIVVSFKGVSKKHLFLTFNNKIRVLRNETNNVDVIPFEDYIVGVLAGEMPVYFDIEALKAQAVASRSYALNKIRYNKDKNYDVVDTVMNQVYLDNETLKKSWGDKYLENVSKIKKAVNETKNEYLDYNGQIVEAFFFSTSTGVTENSENVFGGKLPYLKSVVSTFDEISPLYRVKNTIKAQDFFNKLSLTPGNLKVEYLDITDTGKVNKLKINDKTFSASTIVNTFSLKSYYFTITKEGDNIIITTKGYGHGVGMSQYGAYGMALKGYKYDEILKYYYQGVEIKKISIF